MGKRKVKNSLPPAALEKKAQSKRTLLNTAKDRPERRSFLYGRSVIIGFQKTQIYQWFAGNRQEVFILKNSKMTRTTPPNRTTGGVFIYKTMKGGHFHPASLRTGFFHATKRRFANGR